MPVYAMQCPTCGSEQDIYRRIAEMNRELPVCCGISMQRRIVAPMVAGDIQPYQSMVTGEMIGSRSQHRAHLKQHGVVEVGNEKLPTPKKMAPPPGLKKTLIDVVNSKVK